MGAAKAVLKARGCRYPFGDPKAVEIKKPYKDLLGYLLSSPMHVFICGRQGVEYATDEETEELKAIGVKMKAEGETAYEPHILLRMEAIKPKTTNQMATIIAYAEKDRTGVLSGRSFASPTFETICAPLLGLLGRNQAQIKTSDEVANDDAEAIERADHAMKVQSEELARTFVARIELASSMAALKKIGDGITPQIKAKMMAADLAGVREKYQRRMSALPPDNGKVDAMPPHDIISDEMAAKAQAASAKLVSELTADEAAERFVGMLDKRSGHDSTLQALKHVHEEQLK